MARAPAGPSTRALLCRRRGTRDARESPEDEHRAVAVVVDQNDCAREGDSVRQSGWCKEETKRREKEERRRARKGESMPRAHAGRTTEHPHTHSRSEAVATRRRSVLIAVFSAQRLDERFVDGSLAANSACIGSAPGPHTRNFLSRST